MGRESVGERTPVNFHMELQPDFDAFYSLRTFFLFPTTCCASFAALPFSVSIDISLSLPILLFPTV